VDVGAARTNGANLSGILSRPSAETIKLAIASLEQARNHHAWRRSGGKEGAAARLDGGDLCGADVTGARMKGRACAAQILRQSSVWKKPTPAPETSDA
jgi:hypothetical protein